MDVKSLLLELESVLERGKTGVMSTIGGDGVPRLRWMTGTRIRGRDGFLYSLARPDSAKTAELADNPTAAWIFTDPGFEKVLTLTGKVTVLVNPDLVATIIEAAGGDLATFWLEQDDPGDVCVLETRIKTIELYEPRTGTRVRATTA